MVRELQDLSLTLEKLVVGRQAVVGGEEEKEKVGAWTVGVSLES